MMKLVFIRHGKTEGNLQSRYIGSIDEELCQEGINGIIDNLYKDIYPAADIVFVSPMKRCIQTAGIIYPGLSKRLYVIDKFREIDFGKFEGKSYFELNGDIEYQEWINSGGMGKFPDGEDRELFCKRCITGFKEALIICHRLIQTGILNENATVSFIVHGGTIMSIMEAYAGDGKGSYFNYQCGNGHGYVCMLDICYLENVESGFIFSLSEEF
ncbi:MAG: histidine phosphatase family protein [Lachnospiraceae bacterium]|nr:histidine phosphatase family protein [Lachnospiraceae bacterium]